MSSRRSVQGVWLIERLTGRNLVARAYSGIDIDMDLIAPFLSATHTFIDKASNERLKTIDTESARYVWEANELLLFVMVVSKAARLSHMRFILEYALEEFMNHYVPDEVDLDTYLKRWPGTQNAFKQFGQFIDELVGQYEETDECLVAGKSMDCLEVYSHLFRAIMRTEMDGKSRKKIVARIIERAEPLRERYTFLEGIPIDGAGIEVLSIDVYNTSYTPLRNALEQLLKIAADATREFSKRSDYRDMVFDVLMPYVKRDVKRLQTYAILDDVVKHVF